MFDEVNIMEDVYDYAKEIYYRLLPNESLDSDDEYIKPIIKYNESLEELNFEQRLKSEIEYYNQNNVILKFNSHISEEIAKFSKGGEITLRLISLKKHCFQLDLLRQKVSVFFHH
jgi:hypothetical protein